MVGEKYIDPDAYENSEDYGTDQSRDEGFDYDNARFVRWIEPGYYSGSPNENDPRYVYSYPPMQDTPGYGGSNTPGTRTPPLLRQRALGQFQYGHVRRLGAGDQLYDRPAGPFPPRLPQRRRAGRRQGGTVLSAGPSNWSLELEKRRLADQLVCQDRAPGCRVFTGGEGHAASFSAAWESPPEE